MNLNNIINEDINLSEFHPINIYNSDIIVLSDKTDNGINIKKHQNNI